MSRYKKLIPKYFQMHFCICLFYSLRNNLEKENLVSTSTMQLLFTLKNKSQQVAIKENNLLRSVDAEATAVCVHVARAMLYIWKRQRVRLVNIFQNFYSHRLDIQDPN